MVKKFKINYTFKGGMNQNTKDEDEKIEKLAEEAKKREEEAKKLAEEA